MFLVVVDGNAMPVWELGPDQYEDLLTEQATSMMEKQDTLLEALF